jgi:hypothetical protein
MNELDIHNIRFADFAYVFNKARQMASLPQQAQTIESVSGHTYIRKRISLTFFVKKLILNGPIRKTA